MSSDVPEDADLRRRKPAPAGQDGRLERSRVTRDRIIQAVLELIGSGHLNPTSDDVARHAGVGHRTVFRHFQDMESLFAEMNSRVRAMALSALAEPRSEGPVAQRLEALIRARAAMFEQITAYYLSGEIRLHGSPTLQRARAQFAAEQRRQLLDVLPEVAARPDVTAAIELVTSMDGWLRLRRAQGLSVDESRHAIFAAVTRLLS